MVRVAIDAMGGDKGLHPVVEGTLQALKEYKFTPILVGDEKEIEACIPDNLKNLIKIVHCADYIRMDEAATEALKRKDSSIYIANELVRNKEADCVVSAGHSGSSMSLATLRIGRIKGVLRPAIASHMPTVNGRNSIVVDAGANVDCKPEHLVQFALMGAEYMRSVMKISNPKIGLLSNGEEKSKGNELTKETFAMMQNIEGFIGNVEGNNIFDGSVDVIVCDGFIGNITLKTAEGVAEAIVTIIKQNIQKSIRNKIGALLMKPVFSILKKSIDYAEYGGAPLLGIDGSVIICHGKSNALAIKNAINQAIKSTEFSVKEHISESIESYNRKNSIQG